MEYCGIDLHVLMGMGATFLIVALSWVPHFALTHCCLPTFIPRRQ
jgi:hypothetical protein